MARRTTNRRTRARTKPRGFTLIELMIGLAILAIVLALGVPSFSEMLINSRIRSSAESAVGMLQLARAEAIKRNRDIYFGTVNGPLGGSNWTPQFSAQGTNLAVFADLGGGRWELIDSRSNGEGAGTNNSYASVATAKSVTGTVEEGAVVFNSLGRTRTASGASLNANMVFEFQSPKGATDCIVNAGNSDQDKGSPGRFRCMRVVVSPSGSIRMCDPSITTAGDTRACPT